MYYSIIHYLFVVDSVNTPNISSVRSIDRMRQVPKNPMDSPHFPHEMAITWGLYTLW